MLKSLDPDHQNYEHKLFAKITRRHCGEGINYVEIYYSVTCLNVIN